MGETLCDFCAERHTAHYRDEYGRLACTTHAKALENGDWTDREIHVEPLDDETDTGTMSLKKIKEQIDVEKGWSEGKIQGDELTFTKQRTEDELLRSSGINDDRVVVSKNGEYAVISRVWDDHRDGAAMGGWREQIVYEGETIEDVVEDAEWEMKQLNMGRTFLDDMTRKSLVELVNTLEPKSMRNKDCRGFAESVKKIADHIIEKSSGRSKRP